MNLNHCEPCPNCQRMHAAKQYERRQADQHDNTSSPDAIVFNPPDVACPCGATLRYSVPLFKISAEGWVWRIIKPAGIPQPQSKLELEHAALVAVAEALQSISNLASDPAGSTYTLKELFGTFQHGVGIPQAEGKRALKALANLATVRKGDA